MVDLLGLLAYAELVAFFESPVGLVFLKRLLLLSEGVKAFQFDGRARRVWFYGTMAFAAYNFLVFLGQASAGPSGAVLASIMMALMPMASATDSSSRMLHKIWTKVVVAAARGI